MAHRVCLLQQTMKYPVHWMKTVYLWMFMFQVKIDELFVVCDTFFIFIKWRDTVSFVLTFWIFFLATNSTAKMASIVHIVGGAFITNPSDDSITGPDFLIEHDVILVTFNYRLEIFGFMSLDTPEYSGNMGLKDQLMAIQFVNRNIEHFGGDNTQVTLMGHSAGTFSIRCKSKRTFIHSS